MTKPEILQIVKTLTQDQADDVTISGYFDQLLDDIGRITDDIMTEMETIPLAANTNEYSLPDRAVVEHAIFFDDRELKKTTVHHLEARNMAWRDHTGRPWAYTKDEQTARMFRIYPTPDFSSQATGYTSGEPLGSGFPTDALTIFYSSRNSDEIPSWLILPMVMQIMAWEFSRPSQHQSQAFADLAGQMAVVLFKMVGVNWSPATQGSK